MEQLLEKLSLINVAHAELWNPLPGLDAGNAANIFVNFASQVASGISMAVATLAVLVIVIGGIMYLFAYGNTARIQLAKTMIFGAALGLAIALMAPILGKEIATTLGRDVTGFVLPGDNTVQNAPTLVEVGVRTVRFLLSLVGVLGVLGIIVGGFWYLTAVGDQKKAELGKRTLLYSIIGLIAAIGALIIVKQLVTLFNTFE